MGDFVHLHVHSEHSFLDGVPSVVDLCDRVVELRQSAVALTDHGECSGHLRFQRAALERKIKPIFGMEAYFCEDRFDIRPPKERKEAGDHREGMPYEHLTLIALSDEGRRNLWTLSSLAYIEGFYYEPRVDWELLKRYSKDIVATTGCMAGAVSAFLNEGGKKYDPDVAWERINRFRDIFGDRFYAEVHTYNTEDQKKVNREVARLANELGIGLLAVSDAHYLRPEDWKLHETVFAANTSTSMDDPARYQYGEGQLHLLSEPEVRKRLRHLGDFVDEAVENTTLIASQVTGKIEERRPQITFFDDPKTDAEKLREAAWSGLEHRLQRLGIEGDDRKVYDDRMNFEMDLVQDKGFDGYFLMVADLVVWAKDSGILVGPSRGSVGGSLLAYALRITEIDPISAELSFDRFLDPGRTTLPDIDIDFPNDRYDEVKQYLAKRYPGVATIGTLVAMKPKSALWALGVAFKVPRPITSAMTKIVDQVPEIDDATAHITWSDVMRIVGPELETYEDEYPEVFEYVERFQGRLKFDGMHAAGIVLSKESLLGALPLRTVDGDIRTQMSMDDVEAMGYLKVDALRLRNLVTIQRAMDLAEKNGKEVIHPYEWQYEGDRFYGDKDVFEEQSAGHVIGVFQLETRGMRELIKDWKPRSIDDLCAMIAAFRPGVTRAEDPDTGTTLLESMKARRRGDLPSAPRHADLDVVVGRTYGQFLYQEQIMAATGVLAGYTLAEQDKVRKILGKKKREDMLASRDQFIERSVDRGYPRDIAEVVFRDMQKFGEYGFNRSHGWGYANIAFWCSWLKHHFPNEFLAALFMTNEKQVPMYVREARRMEVPVLGPDVNLSLAEFHPSSDGIRFGLHKIKNVASAAVVIESKRPWQDLNHLFNGVKPKEVRSTAMISLIRAGALDSLVPDDDAMRDRGWSPTKIAAFRYLEWRGTAQKDRAWRVLAPGIDGVVLTDEGLAKFEEWCDEQKINDRVECEKELLGLVLSSEVPKGWVRSMKSADNYEPTESLISGEIRTISGIIRQVRHMRTTKGQNKGALMCQVFVERVVAPADDPMQIVVWPENYGIYGRGIKEGAVVMCQIALTYKGDGMELRSMMPVEQYIANTEKSQSGETPKKRVIKDIVTVYA